MKYKKKKSVLTGLKNNKSLDMTQSSNDGEFSPGASGNGVTFVNITPRSTLIQSNGTC